MTIMYAQSSVCATAKGNYQMYVTFSLFLSRYTVNELMTLGDL